MFAPELARRACWAERGKAEQIGLQHALLAARGTIEAGDGMPETYLGDAIRDLVMHEVGHTLGLRHNFKASSGIESERLHDPEYTGEHGVSLSVMDYNPVNIAPEAEEQGHYWNRSVGTYDEWAITYGYMPVTDQTEAGPLTRNGPLADTSTAERAALRKIARQSSDPLHRYGTDEDTWLGPYAVDPLTNAWELGSDPLAFARTRHAIIEEVTPKLDDRLIAEGERYYRLRQATTALIAERYRSLLPITKTVGGMYVSRDHKGPDARLPFQPVSVDEQEAAVDLLVEEAFAPDAFEFDPERLLKVAPDRHAHWGASGGIQIDFPVHDYVDQVQSGLLGELLHPARLKRMMDNRIRVAEEAYNPAVLLNQLSNAIWAEIEADESPSSIHSFRQNLQRTYTDRLIHLMLDTTTWITISFVAGADQLGAPEQVRSLARLELTELAEDLERALERPPVDRATRAHLLETKERVDRALSASVEVRP